ncbi:MAG: hypothetical protein ACO2ZV_00790, partial [Ilumatobacteraceae bacterium]
LTSPKCFKDFGGHRCAARARTAGRRTEEPHAGPRARAGAEALQAGLVGTGKIVPIEGAAHAANLTHAQLVNPPLIEFLRRVTAA